MVDLNGYNAWKAKREAANIGAAKTVLAQPFEAEPDAYAADMRLAEEFAKTTGSPQPPTSLVTQFRPEFQSRLDGLRQQHLLSSSPMLADWLREPENAEIARDDLEGLSWWETGLKAIDDAFYRSALAGRQSFYQLRAQGEAQVGQDQGRSFDEILADVQSRREPSAIPSLNLGDYAAALGRYGRAGLSSLLGMDSSKNAGALQVEAGKAKAASEAVPMSPDAQRFKDAAFAGESTGDFLADTAKFAADMAADPAGAWAFLWETTVQSTPQLAAAAGATALTRNPTAGAAFMGGLSFLQEAGTSPADFLADKGIDISKPEDVARLMSDPALIREAGDKGVLRGLLVGAFDLISGGMAGETFTKNPLGNMLIDAAVQSLLGAAGDASAQWATKGKIDWRDVLVEGLAELVTSPAEAAGVGGRAFVERAGKAKAAAERRTLFEQLAGMASKSKTRERMPEKYRQFVERATKDGPVENVYVPADKFVEYFQDMGLDPFELVETLDGVTAEDLEIAVATNADLKIPTATYAAKIAGGEHDAFLMDHMRFDPDDMTAAEAKEFNERSQGAMQEAWELAEAIRRDEESLRSYEEQIYDTMVSRLRAAGRSTEVATTEAALHVAVHRVMAERSGMPIEEFLARYPLPQVRGDLPEGMQSRNVDELTRTLAAARQRRAVMDTRPTLFDFIHDYGGIDDIEGELAARDLVEVKRGRGKRTLRLARDPEATGELFGKGDGGKRHGWDDVAKAAIEAGYLADDPTVLDYQSALSNGTEVPDIREALLRAIDDERAGRPQFSSLDPVAAEVDENERLVAIERELAEMGLSLADNDDAIRARLAQAEAGQMYGQADDAAKAVEAAKANLDAATAAFNDMDRAAKFKEGEADRYFELAGAMADAKKAYAEALAGLPGAIVLAHKTDPDRGAMVTRSMDQGAEWRVTYFDRRGFSGDAPRADKIAATTEAVRDGYQTIAPNMLREFSKLPSFTEGNEITERLRQQQTYDQSAIATDTPAFKRWFGDSKVVDAEGNPLVVYHGTPSGKFDAFDPDRPGKTSVLFSVVDTHRQGFYFAEKEGFAQGFADQGDRRGRGGAVMPVYLSIQNPLDVTSMDNASADRLAEVAARMQEIDPSINNPDYIVGKVGHDSFWELLDTAEGGDVLVQAARDLGYDGIKMIEPDLETSDPDYVPDDNGAVTWVAFDPTQIKSVDNRGTFDPADPRILYQAMNRTLFQPAYHGSPHSFDRFSTDKIGTGEGAQAFGWGLYFAGRKDVAQYYRDTLTQAKSTVRLDGATFDGAIRTTEDGIVVQDYALSMVKTYGSVDDAVRALGIKGGGKSETAAQLRHTAAIDWLEANRDRIEVEQPSGRLYHVDVPGDEELLTWDAPLSEQSPQVQDALKALGFEVKPDPPMPSKTLIPSMAVRRLVREALKLDDSPDNVGLTIDNEYDLYQRALNWAEAKGQTAEALDEQHGGVGAWIEIEAKPYLDALRARQAEIEANAYTGKLIYAKLEADLGSDKAASEALMAAGIPGHRFLDGGSRDDGDGTYNYVVYDDNRVSIRTFEQPAWHGSPHLFSKFSTDHMGTGEGAQAYGWGLYFAGDKAVATWYRNKLTQEGVTLPDGRNMRLYSNEDFEFFGEALAEETTRLGIEVERFPPSIGRFTGDTLDMVLDAFAHGDDGKASIDAARDWLLRQQETQPDHLESTYVDSADARGVGVAYGKAVELLDKLVEAGMTNQAGRLYKVDVPGDDELLLWDAPLAEQPEKLRAAVEGVMQRAAEIDGRTFDEYRERALDKGTRLANVYDYLTAAFAGKDRASQALLAAGIPGHKYLDGSSRRAGEGSYNYVIYDDGRIDITDFEQPDGSGGGPRGSIQFPSTGIGNGDTIINLFRSADLSTMLHESGHYFLTVLQNMAERGIPYAVNDLDVVKDWWHKNAADVARDAMRVMPDVTVTADDVKLALDGGTTGDRMKDLAIDVGMQEQFARGFEAYLMEGKSPSVELRGTFEKFRAWLISIYKSLTNLQVTLSDDIRGVFDRMVASDAEIAKAQAKVSFDPMFASAEDMGLTDEEYRKFLALHARAEDEAKARLLKKAIEPIRRAKEASYKEERKNTREEVAQRLALLPVYRAIEWMANRRWLGEGKPEAMPDFRLSRAILVERYGEGVLTTLNANRGLQTVYAVDGGLDPDEAAGWFGFATGDDLVKAIENAPDRKAAIEAETDRIMRERHGDALNDGEIEGMALDAVHSELRGRALAAELQALHEIWGTGSGIKPKEAREVARRVLARMKVRDAANPSRFLAAERKAGQKAAALHAEIARNKLWMDAARRRIESKARAVLGERGTADTIPAAVEKANKATDRYNELAAALVTAKQQQLLNHMMYDEARKIADEVASAERLAKRLGRKSTRAKLAGDYLAAIDDILETYDFRAMSRPAEERRAGLLSYVKMMQDAGRESELSIPDEVLNNAKRQPYKTLTVEFLRGVVDSLKNIEHTARLKQKLLDAQAERELDDVVAEITDAFGKNVKPRPPGRVNSKAEERRNWRRGFLDLVLNATTILREIDGFKDMGAAYRHLKAPIDAAMDRLALRRQAATASIEALYDVYSKVERRKMAVRVTEPALGFAISKWEKIAIALNTGNAGNFQRLTDPRVKGSLTAAQVQAVLDSLDERDARFVQSVWDYLDSFRPDLEAREKRRTGVVPEWVEATPVTIAGLQLTGGYYPLKYDARLSSLARDDQAEEVAKSLQSGRFAKAQTRNGHLKERAKASGRPVEYDIGVLHRHVNQVIYDLELSEPVNNAWRVLMDARVRDTFREHGKAADFDALELWLKDAAEGEVKSADVISSMARRFKSNFTAAKLALNLGTVLMQVTGLPQSMVVVGKRNMTVGILKSLRPGVHGEIAERSAFMATRQTTFNKDIFDFYNDPKMGGGVGSMLSDFKQGVYGPLAFYLMTKVQYHLVDVPTWLAGYRQGIAQFGADEAKAIAHADGVVKRAQASGLFTDRSAIERGSVSRSIRQNDLVRLLFTTLASYMYAKFNVAYERTAKAGRVIGEEGVSLRSTGEVLAWTLDMVFLFTVEAVVVAALKGRLPSDDDDEDEEWLGWLAKETGASLASTIPFIRDVAGLMQGFDAGGAYGGMMAEIAEVTKQLAQGEPDKAAVRAVINATGLATGIPSTQINRAVDSGWRALEGEDVSPVEYLLGRRR